MKTDLDISQYKSFYKKSPKAKYFKFRSDTTQLSHLCDFSKLNESKGIDSCSSRCINDPNNVTKLIKQKESDVIYVSEGLIKTYPTKKFIDRITNFIENNTDASLHSIRFCDVNSYDNDQDLLSGFVSKEDEVGDVSPSVSFVAVFRDEDDVQEFAKKITDTAYVYGYSLTAIDKFDHDLMPDVIVKVFQFEAKYSNNEFEFADTLIHVAPLKYLPKILKHGLVPSAKSAEYKYASRVYLFNKCSEKMTLAYAEYKMNEVNDVGFCVFKIKTSKLLNSEKYKAGKIRFYVDSSYEFSDKANVNAIFTYDNIDKSLLDDAYLKYEMKNGKLERTIEKI